MFQFVTRRAFLFFPLTEGELRKKVNLVKMEFVKVNKQSASFKDQF